MIRDSHTTSSKEISLGAVPLWCTHSGSGSKPWISRFEMCVANTHVNTYRLLMRNNKQHAKQELNQKHTDFLLV